MGPEKTDTNRGFRHLFAGGRRLQKLLSIKAAGPVEDIAVSMAIGLGVLDCALFAAGMLGGYFPWFFIALLALAALICRREIPALWSALRHMNQAWGETRELAGWPGTLFSAFAMVFEAATIMFALAPSLTFDVVRFHLPAVQYFANHHALLTPPYLPYAYYPQGVEAVMTLGYELAGQAAAQLLPALYFALALLALFRLSRICGLDRFSALAGILFTVSIPAIHWTGGSGKNDFALVFFILAAVLAYLRWMETRLFQWILLGAFFLSMGAGVKHIVLFALPPIVLLYAYAAWVQPRRVLAFARLAAVFLAFGLLWHVRTWIATGNPLYPSGAVSAVSPGASYHHSMWRDVILPYVQYPWAVHFRGRIYFESVSEYPMGIILVLFAPLWLLVRKRLSPARNACLLFCGAYLLYWALVIPMIRYAIAPIAMGLTMTAGLLIRFSRAMPRAIVASVLAACAYGFVFSALAIAINELNAPQLLYFARRIDRREYLREAMLPYRSIEYLKSAAKPGDAILGVDSCALAYAPNEDRFDCLLLEWEPWNRVATALAQHPYRFMILPQAHAGDVPAGWNRVYADSGYGVYRNSGR